MPYKTLQPNLQLSTNKIQVVIRTTCYIYFSVIGFLKKESNQYKRLKDYVLISRAISSGMSFVSN